MALNEWDPEPQELDRLARTRHMPALQRSNGQRLVTARECYLDMAIGCTLCFGIGLLAGIIGMAIFA